MREARLGRITRSRATLVVSLLVLGCTIGLRTPAQATQKFGPLELSGNLETQNLVRDSSINSAQFIQNRNTFRLRVDYDWLQNGKLIDRIEMPFIERSKLFLLYRGVYDGFYDMAPGDLQRGQTRYDDLIGGSIKRLSSGQRNGAKFENRMREAYVDFKLKDAPLSFRLGRQQVIWGESDQFRIMDIWNPLDTSWHFQQESWDNIRVPLWLGKGLWDIGQVGPLSNAFLEVVYNPGDFQPGIKANFLPDPWGLPFPDPLRPGQIQNIAGNLKMPQFNLHGTSFADGDFRRNPQDASEVGVRAHFVTPQGIELSANYLYGRGRGVGAASPFAVQIDRITLQGGNAGQYQIDSSIPASAPGNLATVRPLSVDAKIVHPYMHIFGLTGNYFEGDFTDTVVRFESAFAMGEPYQTTEAGMLPPVCKVLGKNLICPTQPGPGEPPLGPTDTGPFQLAKRDIWTGMIGFDRPTWIRFLNPRATWFLSGQIFWNYIPGKNVDQLVGTSGAGDAPYFGPVGKWVSNSINPSLVGQVERQQDGVAKGNGDNIRRWEHLITIAATSFYRGGTIVPFIADAWDPVNDNDEVLWNVDYYYTNNLIVSLQQKFFFTYGSNAPSNDPWYAGGRFTRRDETGVKITYQF
jgi:hypothetical protein